MKLVLVQQLPSQDLALDSVYLSSQADLSVALKTFAAGSFTLIEAQAPLRVSDSLVGDKEIWKLLFSILRDNGNLNLNLDSGISLTQAEQVTSFMKLNGFTNVHVQDQTIQGKKPQWQAAGAPLKRKQQQQQETTQANPWGQLQQSDSNLINEDELMKDVTTDGKEVYQKFCGEDDKVKVGKPCENCTCGRKEIEEGKITEKDLETGNVQSNCGKCYLGDAFRCASCPYLGQPAFEPGDKVQLKTSVGQQTVKLETEEVKVKTTVGKAVKLEL